MNGQWFGKWSGISAPPVNKPTSGLAIMNADDRGDRYSGIAFMNEDGPEFISSAATFNIEKKEKTFSFKTNILPIHPEFGTVTSWTEIKKIMGQNITYSRYVDVKGQIVENTLSVEWKTELGATGWTAPLGLDRSG